jgi:hypothetical protein
MMCNCDSLCLTTSMYITVTGGVCQRLNSIILSKKITQFEFNAIIEHYCAKIILNNELLIENKLRIADFFDTIISCNCVGWDPHKRE